MKAEELRLGNYVYYLEYDFYEDNVFATGEKSVDTIDLNSLHEIFFGNDNLLKGVYEPIPLTEEWLLNLGFEKYDSTWFRKMEMPSITKETIDIRINVITKCTCVFGDEFLEPAFFKECENVHQLQNLYFALTGEELEIKKL